MADPDPLLPKRRPSRRLSDASVIAPILGFILLIPPIIGLFAVEREAFGAPVILVYLFGIWLALILVAALLSRALRRAESEQSNPP